ncbi:MAG TPA: PDZ domain-containing protein [Fimbriimonadaceae bacterium]|nr:PDZ domain-containing protein [Fimbriimonadaceae bacterium]HRJ31941.1 PDZ domain-containing protein [Fimbriimonadaceae bacterium]
MVRSLLAVSLVLLSGSAQAQLSTDPLRNWSSIERSVVTIDSGARPVGLGALIDRSGLFLVHRNVLPSTQSVGRLSNGQVVMLSLKATDEISQMSVVQAEPWDRSIAPEVALAPVEMNAGQRLILGLPNAPLSGELVSGDRSGILRPSLRYAPLLELRSEAPTDRLGGALVFTPDGTLAGVIHATLAPAQPDLIPRSPASQPYGPRPMTTSYALGPEILQKVIEGFRSPSRRVVYPSIGAFFSDASQGVLVQEVRAGSPADQAGIQSRDVVLLINQRPIKDSIDFAVQLFRQRVGSVITLRIRRDQQQLDVKVAVAGTDETRIPLR